MNTIISFVMLGSKDFEQSSKFYDAIFAHLGLKKITTTERYIGYGYSDEPEEVRFYITKPYNKKTATVGNGTMVALLADSKNAVNKLSNNQLNLLFVFVNTPSVISSSPTPANLRASSSASSFNTVKTSSDVIMPTSLLFLSTTHAEFNP